MWYSTGWSTQAELETSGTCLLCTGTAYLSYWTIHLLCIRNCKCSSLQTDLVEEQIGEEFHRFTPSRLPPHGFTGSQERGLSSGVAPVDLSSTFHQQADQAKLTGGCRADEGAAVGKGVCHGLSGEGESDHHCQQQQPYYIIQIATAKQLKPLPWACFACCVKNQ